MKVTHSFNIQWKSVWQQTSTIFLICAAPAVITTVPMDSTATVQEDIQVSCIASGLPKPLLGWFRRGELLMNSSRYSITSECPEPSTVVSYLAISDVQLSDAGMFSCYVNNDVGNSSAEFTLTVLCKNFNLALATTYYIFLLKLQLLLILSLHLMMSLSMRLTHWNSPVRHLVSQHPPSLGWLQVEWRLLLQWKTMRLHTPLPPHWLCKTLTVKERECTSVWLQVMSERTSRQMQQSLFKVSHHIAPYSFWINNCV